MGFLAGAGSSEVVVSGLSGLQPGPSRPRAARLLLGVLVPARVVAATALVLFLVIVLLSVRFHEPWADEAQSWLLARDSTLTALWTDVPHYEGTPPLWHTLLHLLIGLGLPYGGLNVVSALLGFAAAALLLRFSPWPLWVRVAAPFTFFLCYQYPVVARNYSLLPVLLFSAAALYRNPAKHLWLFTLTLCLTAAVSVHGFVLSLAIALSYGLAEAKGWKSLHRTERKKRAAAAVVYGLSLAALAAIAWPATDVTFSAWPAFTWNGALEVLAATAADAFAGHWVVSVFVVALSLPYLKKGGALAAFALSTALLLFVAVVIYSHAWHRGLVFLAWLFAMWTAGYRARMTRAALVSLAVVTGIQASWTLRSVAYDWRQPYSGSRQAAEYLHTAGIDREELHAVGFSSTSLQPYFPQNRFANWSGRRNGAFWDWSPRNRVNEPIEVLASRRPYLVVGYKSAEEQKHWARYARVGGYARVRHFEGNLFWRSAVLEPEAFDVYRLSVSGGRPPVMSTLNMADPAAADQLISGFHPIEAGAWRWTAKRFSAILGRPPGAEQTGAVLEVRLFLPAAQVARLGAMTLSTVVNGRSLEPRTFTREGQYVCSYLVPATAFASGIIPVEFRFNRAVAPTAHDHRELAAIVTSIELRAR